MEPHKVDLVGVGLNAMDTLIPLANFPARGSKMEYRDAFVMPGGQVATTVVACQTWGLRTRYVGKLADDHVYVQMSLDRSQASGVHEKEILAKWSNDSFGNSIAIGTSSVRNAISHLKIVIVDGVYTVKGSTNWSLSGEQEQDNELTLSRNAVIAAETRAVLDLNHDFMLKQMVGSKLDVTSLMAPSGAGATPPLPPAPASAPASE